MSHCSHVALGSKSPCSHAPWGLLQGVLLCRTTSGVWLWERSLSLSPSFRGGMDMQEKGLAWIHPALLKQKHKTRLSSPEEQTADPMACSVCQLSWFLFALVFREAKLSLLRLEVVSFLQPSPWGKSAGKGKVPSVTSRASD